MTTTDIAKRLRAYNHSLMHEAADDIERRDEEIKQLKAQIADARATIDEDGHEIGQLKAALNTCRELRKYDEAEIERLRGNLEIWRRNGGDILREAEIEQARRSIEIYLGEIKRLRAENATLHRMVQNQAKTLTSEGT